MTQKIAVLTLSLAVTAALTAERFVDATGATATAAGNALGVTTTDAAAAGDLVGVDVLGTSVVTASAAIAKGAAVEVAAGGKAATKATGITVGRALQAATADGDRIEVMLIPN